MNGARPSTQRSGAPPSPPSCRKTSPNGARRSRLSATQPESSTSSSPGISPASRTASATHAQAPATSARTRPAAGVSASSPLPLRRQPCSLSSLPSSVPPPYSLRRGGISLRLRAEDPQTVASECGTQPTHAQQALRLRDRGSPPQRTTPSRHRVARRTRRTGRTPSAEQHAWCQRRSAPSPQNPQLAPRPQAASTEDLIRLPKGHRDPVHSHQPYYHYRKVSAAIKKIGSDGWEIQPTTIELAGDLLLAEMAWHLVGSVDRTRLPIKQGRARSLGVRWWRLFSAFAWSLLGPLHQAVSCLTSAELAHPRHLSVGAACPCTLRILHRLQRRD